MDSPRKLKMDDKAYLWHPYTQMAEYALEEPVVIVEAKGSRLKDIQGRWYLDGVSSLWVNVHGHRHPQIDGAIKKQLRKVAHTTLLGLANPPAIKLAARLVALAPAGLTRVFYSDNGSTAVEIALKMSYQYWQQAGAGGRGKTTFVSFKNGYHGDTLGCVGLGGIPFFHDRFRPLTFEPFWADSPYCYRCSLGLDYPDCNLACLKSLEQTLALHSQEIAAVIIEPKVQAAGGMIVSPPGFLRRVRELCYQYSIHLIADEVAVGFGRTGTLFACEQERVAPDFLCLAKGITGGYLPLAATLTTEEVYQAFLGRYAEFKAFFHGHTYTGNPLACAAALASLELFEQEGTLEKLKDKITLLEKELERFVYLSQVGQVRQCGLMVGIELVKDKATKACYPPHQRVGHQVILAARARGLIIRPLGDVIVLMPPLSATIEEIKEMADIVYDSLRAITESA